ncbi:MAG TPA: DUF4404 domain-containing protein [Janthinobacterium sp.]|nr:DUF4404 domain-containing protein [Janthinobacterium sp.]
MDSNLKASLQNLHAQLEAGGPVDEELQGLLKQLDGDIKKLLEPEPRAHDDEGSSTYGLAERTQEISAKFAVQHPQLEPALRELGNILSSMGI